MKPEFKADGVAAVEVILGQDLHACKTKVVIQLQRALVHNLRLKHHLHGAGGARS